MTKERTQRGQKKRMSGSILVWGVLSCLVWGCESDVDKAAELIQKKQYQEAANVLKQVLQRTPGEAKARRGLAEIYCEHLKNYFHCYTHAKHLYRRSRQDSNVRKWYKIALMSKAKEMFRERRLKTATDYVKQYLKMEKKNAKCYFMLANAKLRQNRQPPYNDRQMKQAIKEFKLAIKYSKPEEKIAIFEKKHKANLRWEAHMGIARLNEMWLLQDYAAWKRKQKAKEAREKKKKKRRRRRGKKKEEREKFPMDEEKFNEAVKHYTAASEILLANKFKRPLPLFQIGMFYARFQEDYKKALEWLKKGEDVAPNDPNIICNSKMIYDKLAEEAEEARKKSLQKKYEKKSQDYDSKCASLRAKK